MDGETTTIGQHTYRVRHIDPLTATDITVDLAKLFGPVFAAVGGTMLAAPDTKKQLKSLLDGEKPEAPEGGEDPGTAKAIERALTGLFNNLTKDQVRYLINVMMPVTEVKKGDNWPQLETIFDVHFRGDPAGVFKWLAFAMRVNFKGFFSGMAGAIGRAARQMGLEQ